ncbi:PAS domain-containing protein [Desulfuromusa kysingii]|uniref:histidine kinase n=1 Tax=Desulfuromusa kysingii TaxID=37625 RepID=A0A1H4AZH1_9BACT|nr:ATP-binding protein [Desulfuromusa kysingii]SEA41321.1 PAS domain-containing protein [Desulfuromusa kysingii]
MVSRVFSRFRFKRSAIAKKIILFIILFSSLVTLIGTSFQLYLEYQRDIRSVRNSVNQIENSYLDSIIESLWVANPKFLKIQLEGILRLSDIEHLEIRHNGQQVMEVGAVRTNKVIKAHYPLSREYRNEQIPLGDLTITASTAGVYQRLLDRLIVTMGTQAVKTFIVTLFMFLVFYYLVGRHLLALADYTEHLDFENFDRPLQLNRKKRRGKAIDEFDHLVGTFNTMRANLKKSFDRLQRSNDQLKNEVKEREATEKALFASQKQFMELSQEFQAILNGIPDALMLRNRNNEIVWANQGAAQLFDLDITELPGQHCYQLWGQRNDPCDFCSCDECFESGETKSIQITRTDGRIWEKKVFPIKNYQNEVEKVIVWNSDITEKQRLTEDAQRTGRLAALGELAAGVAHEINNPNSLILINAPLLQKAWNQVTPILDQYYQEHKDDSVAGLSYEEFAEVAPCLFEDMYEGALRIKRIVNDLKDFVRQDHYTEYEMIDLNEVVHAAIRLSGNSIKNATESFSLNCSDDLPKTLGRFQAIEQVVINLLLNACQSLTKSTQKLEISTWYDEDQQLNCIQVVDEGCGISSDNLEKITDPFFTTKRDSGGTGLGLSLSLKIVKEHCGALDFISGPGQGTIVTLSIPVTGG